jgi:two-component system response regulator HydG
MSEQANVLVVDDNDGLLETFSLILKRRGYNVETADNGVSALEKYRKNHYDVTIMDIVMPQMNGVETFRRIKEIDPAARVILMTAYYDDQEIRLALEEGAYNAINKPVDIPQLLGMIKGAMIALPILIVDDDIDFCKTIARALELKGHRVTAVSSGKEAVRIASEKKIQIAFIDIRMPLMDGMETYLRMKELNPGLKAVMMTAYRHEMRDTINDALAAEVRTCLYKPFSPEEVLDLVHLMDIH